MTREELQEFIDHRLGFCGCGEPEQALKLIKGVLTAIDYSDQLGWPFRAKWFNALMPTTAIRMFVLNTLGAAGLTEHGSGIEGAWLTDEGRAFLTGLREHGVYLDDEEYSEG